jgi:hypothetical protein
MLVHTYTRTRIFFRKACDLHVIFYRHGRLFIGINCPMKQRCLCEYMQHAFTIVFTYDAGGYIDAPCYIRSDCNMAKVWILVDLSAYHCTRDSMLALIQFTFTLTN